MSGGNVEAVGEQKRENNYAFIDSQNLNLSVRECGWELDFLRFRIYLQDKYHASKAFLFIGYVSGNEALYTQLQKAGYIVIFKPTLSFEKGGKYVVKGNVDAEMVLHTMIEYPNYDKALIVSGDGDFFCLVEYLVKQGKLLHIMIPNRRRYSSLLRKFHSFFVFIDGLQKKVGKNKSGSNLRTGP